MKPPFKTIGYSLLMVALTATHVAAADTPSNDERSGLLALLDEQTAIATKTKLNADYVPGIVTVLLGDDLEARGVRTVWEALSLVPGVDLTLDPVGRKQLLIRGIGDSIASGNVKIMLNDVAMNSSSDGKANPILDLPVEQLERIEVIRGPGSAIHGEYAYAGVINVVTRHEGQRVYAMTGSAGTAGGGGVFSWSNDDLHLDLNLASTQNEGSKTKAGTDVLYNTTPNLAAYSYAPGPINDASETNSAIFNLGYRDFSLLAQWNNDGSGDYFGYNSILPPPVSRIVSRYDYQSVVATQTVKPSNESRVEIKLGWQQTAQENNGRYLGPSEAIAGVPGPDYLLYSRYNERKLLASVDYHWEGWQQHQILLGIAQSQTEVTDSWSRYNSVPIGTIPVGTKRTVTSVTAQDEYRYSDGFTLTTGIRYDEYSDVGNRLTPRIAGVWRLDERNIVKAQYAQAFRPPNFSEIQNGGGNLRSALIDTYELGYIFKGERHQTRINAFYSDLTDLIVFDGSVYPPQYRNYASARVQGVELQQKVELRTDLAADGYVSYLDSRDSQTGQAIAGSAHWLGSLGLTKQLSPTIDLNLQYHYVGDRQRENTDPRNASSGYQTIDTTMNLRNVGYKGLTVHAGVKNILDENIRFPAPMNTDITGTPPPPIVSYWEDYPGPERTWWLQLSYRY